MKYTLLLSLLLLFCGLLSAQVDDTIRTLVITEARMDRADKAYIELTNMGTDTLDLSEFQVGRTSPWTDPVEDDPFQSAEESMFMLPEVQLLPGKSFVIASFREWTEEQYAIDFAKFGYSPDHNERITKAEMWDLADIQIHSSEAPITDPTDSVSDDYGFVETWSGRDSWWIRHHVTATDSVVIDQVGGVFTDADGTNPDGGDIDVAGVTGATGNSILVRRFIVKQGSKNFKDKKGTGYVDSEWIPIPRLGVDGGYEVDRAVFWTLGNHGDYGLDENTLVPKSDDIDVNWDFKLITLPWGIRNDDSLMFQFERRPGLAWDYIYAANHEDSAYVSCRNGDEFVLYACGDELEDVKFSVLVVPPTNDANIVIPKRQLNDLGFYDDSDGAHAANIPYEVTDKIPGMDTISNVGYATRVDSLLKYLEKPVGAEWEIIWKDGPERTDLIDGDILRVTAKDGVSVKDYYIKVDDFRKSLDPTLNAITWPDIPAWLKDNWGWKGDTIPNFASGKRNYRVEVPFATSGIPALVATTTDVNATVEMKRATTLFGSPEDRTITFTVTAEDDTSETNYTVELYKQKDPTDIQPWSGEPFISQWVFQEEWDNYYLEIYNPGNQVLDLSQYMIIGDWSDNPLDVISWYAEDDSTADWLPRYRKYIPGYKWVDYAAWKSDPATVEKDNEVTALVQPGDVFVLGHIINGNEHEIAWDQDDLPRNTYPATEQCDVIFRHFDPANTQYDNEYGNPWNEPVSTSLLSHWYGSNIYLYKMDSAYVDSIHNGEIPVTNPAAFIHIETFGEMDGTGFKPWDTITQMETAATAIRKPEFYLPKPGARESFGNTAEESEWIYHNRDYFSANDVGYPLDVINCTEDLGTHFMNEVTVYMSRINSIAYAPSGGFSQDESMRGVLTGTTVDQFVANIIKADTGQALILLSGATAGDTLSGSDVLADGDTMAVVSANLENITKYVLEVNTDGLNEVATLTSTVYEVTDDGSTGTITGMDYSDRLADVIPDISTTDPAATMMIIDDAGSYVPFKILKFDTTYVDVMVNDQIFIEAVAENGTTKILYQLKPSTTTSDAFITSDVFVVDQEKAFIDLIPGDISVQTLFLNIVPAPGASVMIVDKLGFQRVVGNISRDDKLVVTSEDGEVTKVYYLKLLPEEADQPSDYLAYVLSDVYKVNQVSLTIGGGGLTDATELTVFKGNLTAATGATFTIVDIDDVENTGSTLRKGDLVKVVAEDGATTSYYSIEVHGVAVNELTDESILVYPNPSTGKITINGIEPGNRIRIYNMLGMAVVDIITSTEMEVISLDEQPDGLYFIVVSDKEKAIGQYKLILE